MVITPREKTAILPIDYSLTSTESTSASRFIFSSTQSNLEGSELVYDVTIRRTDTEEVS